MWFFFRSLFVVFSELTHNITLFLGAFSDFTLPNTSWISFCYAHCSYYSMAREADIGLAAATAATVYRTITLSMSPHSQSQVASLNRYIIHLKANKQHTHARTHARIRASVKRWWCQRQRKREIRGSTVQYCRIVELSVKSRRALKILSRTRNDKSQIQHQTSNTQLSN